MYYAYVLENPEGRFYIGQTESLERRLLQYSDPNAHGAKYAPKSGPWTLVWSEDHELRSEATCRERQIKAMKSPRWIRERLLKRSRACPVGRASPGAPGLTAGS